MASWPIPNLLAENSVDVSLYSYHMQVIKKKSYRCPNTISLILSLIKYAIQQVGEKFADFGENHQ